MRTLYVLIFSLCTFISSAQNMRERISGTFVTTDVDVENLQAKVKASVEVVNESDEKADVIVRNYIIDAKGNVIDHAENSLSIKSLGKNEINTCISWWTNEPTLHILPHWNDLGTDSVKVQAYPNMDEVELFLNDRSLGKRMAGKYDIPTWHVKYTPGKLTLKGKKENRQYIETMETTGSPALLQLISETGNSIKGDNNDIAVITVRVLDTQKRLVPTANDRITFKVKNGIVSGVGNGDPSCHKSDTFPKGAPVKRSVFSGCAQLIVKSDQSGKPIDIIATSEKLKEARILINIE